MTTQVFIKKDNLYAVPYFNKMPMPILSLVHYLIDEKKIDSPLIIDIFKQASALCQRELGLYVFPFIHLALDKKPNQQMEFQLDEIESSYQNILTFYSLYKVLLKEVNLHYLLISKLRNHQLRDYFDLDSIKNKMSMYSWQFKKQQLDNFDNILFNDVAYLYFDKIFADEMKPVLKIWKAVTSKEGKILNTEQVDIDVPYFNESVYLVYGKNRQGVSGYATGWDQVGKMSEARLYQSIDTANKQRHIGNPTIVQASIIFKKIALKNETSESSRLDGFIASEEKKKLDNEDTPLTLAQKLLEYVQDNEVLKSELEKIIHSKRSKETEGKKRSKI
jgi:hypothetical protein